MHPPLGHEPSQRLRYVVRQMLEHFIISQTGEVDEHCEVFPRCDFREVQVGVGIESRLLSLL